MGLGTGVNRCVYSIQLSIPITTVVVDKESNSDSSEVHASLCTNEARASPLA